MTQYHNNITLILPDIYNYYKNFCGIFVIFVIMCNCIITVFFYVILLHITHYYKLLHLLWSKKSRVMFYTDPLAGL